MDSQIQHAQQIGSFQDVGYQKNAEGILDRPHHQRWGLEMDG